MYRASRDILRRQKQSKKDAAAYINPDWIETFFLPHIKLLETHLPDASKVPLFAAAKAPLMAPAFYGLQQVTKLPKQALFQYPAPGKEQQNSAQQQKGALSTVFEPHQMFRHLENIPTIMKAENA